MNGIPSDTIAEVRDSLLALHRRFGMNGVVKFLDAFFQLIDESDAPEGVMTWLLLYDAAARRADELMRGAFTDAGGDPGPARAFFTEDAFRARLDRFVPALFGEDLAAYGPTFTAEAHRIALYVISNAAGP